MVSAVLQYVKPVPQFLVVLGLHILQQVLLEQLVTVLLTRLQLSPLQFAVRLVDGLLLSAAAASSQLLLLSDELLLLVKLLKVTCCRLSLHLELFFVEVRDDTFKRCALFLFVHRLVFVVIA